MILKHSIRSVIRTPKKTLLFMVLLTVLTIILSIGAGMYESACNMERDADQTFTTIMELNYLGDVEGNEVEFYKNMNLDLDDFDFNKLRDDPHVKKVDMEKSAWAYIEGNTIKRNISPLNTYVMVKVGNAMKYEDHVYMGVVNEIMFGKKVRESSYIMINEVDEQGNPLNYNFISDHEYLVIGKVANGRTKTYNLSPGLPALADNLPSVIDLTENPDFFQSVEGLQALKLQEAMTMVENSLEVTAVSSLEASSPYYFNEIVLKEGRAFSPTEYESNNCDVIIISEAVAELNKVKLGEKLKLKLHFNKSGLGRSELLKDFTIDHEASYEVIGIFDNREENKYMIYMPTAPWLVQDKHSTTLARYMVNNGAGADFINNNKNKLLPNMEFTLFDQGYGEAVKPIIALRNSALIIILLGALSGIAILTLFSYLYVLKQRDTLKTMLSLGTGKRRTLGYILYGSVALVFCSAMIGSLISTSFLVRATKMIFGKMMNTYATDLRYSERRIGLQINFIPEVRINLLLPFIVVIIVLIVGFILLFSFTFSILYEDRQVSVHTNNKKVKPILPRSIKIKKMKFGRVRPITFKFALLSLARSPGRSFIIPLISFILSFFIIFLGLLSSIQQEKLDTVYDRIPVTAYMTSPKNETRDTGGLNLEKDIYRLLDPTNTYHSQRDNENYWDFSRFDSSMAEEERDRILTGSEFFEDMYLYTALHYEYIGILKTKAGEVDEELSPYPNIRFHNNNYGFDWFLNQMKTMPKLAYADDIRFTPSFYNNAGPEVEFLEGYNYDSLRQKEDIGIISDNLAMSYGIKNGDTIRITAWLEFEEAAVCRVIDFKVIGIYDAKWRTDTIYLPWIRSYDHNYCFDYQYQINIDGTSVLIYDYVLNELIPKKVRAVTFTLKNTDNLSSFRDYLETVGYSQVGKIGENRRVIVIQDKRLVETVQNLKNHLRLIDTIKPIMLILFGIIGFAVSYILIKHRMSEFAIMRSLGAKRRQVFLSFFLEQMILFMIGLLPAVIYALMQPSKLSLYGASLLFFILCYLTGTSIALFLMNRAKILDILFTKE